jgi:phosphopantetheinyl transferase (holo-ACP synthase)
VPCSVPIPHRQTLALAIDSPAGEAWLTDAERLACAAIADARRRRDWRAARLAGKWAVAGTLGLRRSDDVEILTVPGSPPSVAVREEDGGVRLADVTLSLAHRHGRGAAVAAAGQTAVGVDLERETAIPAEHERYFLTAAERVARRRWTATALWALKEAAWKALRCADSVYFATLELCFDEGLVVRGVSLGGAMHPASATLTEPWPGFLLAVVRIEGKGE